MKIHVRTLWGDDDRPLWYNESSRRALQRHLNDLGFYVLAGVGDSLDVYVIEYAEPLDVLCAKNMLAKIKDLWYTELRGKDGAK